MLLSINHLNVTDDKQLLPRFVSPFSIVQWVGPLAYWVKLGTHYSQVHPIFHISLFKPICAGGDGYPYPTAVYVLKDATAGLLMSNLFTTCWGMLFYVFRLGYLCLVQVLLVLVSGAAVCISFF